MYRFSLEPVLKHRKLIEEELQKEMAELKRRLLSEQEKLVGLEKIKRRCLLELQEKQARGIKAPDISLYSNFIGLVTIQIEGQQKKVLSVERNLVKKRTKLIQAVKERKMVDQLKENRLMIFERNERRKELKLVDEMALAGFHKSRQSGSK